jgi:hypothetical protein
MTEPERSKRMTQVGPTYGNPDARNVPLSAAQLAGLANVRLQDIQYWGRKGYLSSGQDCNGSQYQLSQLPKAQLMALFAKRLQMNAEKASQIAEDLLRLYENKPDAFKATIAMVEALESKISDFVSMIVDLNLVPRIGEMLEEEKIKAA